jgi:hypothetical protein
MGPQETLESMLKTVTLVSLKVGEEAIDELLILSYDPGLYLAQVRVRGCLFRVIDQDGANLVFRSQMAAKKAFEGLNVIRAMLEHQSSYDEMIGLDCCEQTNRLQVPISLLFND